MGQLCIAIIADVFPLITSNLKQKAGKWLCTMLKQL